MTTQTKDSGFDIIKVDFQSNNLAFNKGTENPVLGVHYNNRALEENCKEKKLSLLNCIAMQNFNVFNQTYSDLIRGSIDYKTTINRIDLSIVQNFMNAFWLGHTHWIDQDMFHTSYKETARLMARCRALSGGPIYLSDATQDIDDEYIKPLIYEDGKIIGTLAPGVPLPESLLNDPYTAKKAFKVIAPLENKTASLMAIKLNRSGRIKTSLSQNDYTYAGGMIQPYEGLWTLPEEGLLLYDYSSEKAQVFVEDYEFELNTREERLFQLSPIHNGWSVIGRPDKFLSAQTFHIICSTPNKIEIQMKEDGPLLLWCIHKIPVSTNYTFKQTGDHLWYGTLNKPTKSKCYSISMKE